MALPDDLDYARISGLSNELQQKFIAVRPRSLGQAGRIEGVTPAALALIAAHARRSARRAEPDPGPGRVTRAARPGDDAERLARDRAAALRLVPVSRETEARLDLYVELLGRWRRVTNLIGETTFASVWTRHIADSAQLPALAPQANRWVDLGSGAGFPGLVIAIQLAEVAGARSSIASKATGASAPSCARSPARPTRRRRFMPCASRTSTPTASDLWTP